MYDKTKNTYLTDDLFAMLQILDS